MQKHNQQALAMLITHSELKRTQDFLTTDFVPQRNPWILKYAQYSSTVQAHTYTVIFDKVNTRH